MSGWDTGTAGWGNRTRCTEVDPSGAQCALQAGHEGVHRTEQALKERQGGQALRSVVIGIVVLVVIVIAVQFMQRAL